MTTAPWLAAYMLTARGGARGFLVGTIGGAAGGALSAWALYVGSFPLFLAGSYLTGIYMSAQNFYRFGRDLTASPKGFRAKAVSYVLAGGLLSAIFGPQLNKLVQTAFVVPFVGTYLAVIAINIVGAFLFFGLDLPKPVAAGSRRAPGRAQPDGASARPEGDHRRDLRDGLPIR